MTEEKMIDKTPAPTEDLSEKNGESINVSDDKNTETVIPIKFNKEVKNLTVDEAAALAQKGMKYDLICSDYATLKQLSQHAGMSVSAYLESKKQEIIDKRKQELCEKCGGDTELAEHILKLETEKSGDSDFGFYEVKKYFPQYKNIEDLPIEVLEAAKEKGSLLLDELLRFRLEEKKRREEAIKLQKENELLSTGSQLNRKGAENPEATEFLKGLWK